jgi:antitoxin (DNA-binding transcriptional repressor) of toxin-antitoxin stability system
MTRNSIVDVRARLDEIIAGLRPTEEVEITQSDRPVARLVGIQLPPKEPRRLGTGIGKVFVVAEDDEHLKDFEDDMP